MTSLKSATIYALIFVFIITMSTNTYAIYFNLKNITSMQDAFRVNTTRTTMHIYWGKQIATISPSYDCQYKDQITLPACIGQGNVQSNFAFSSERGYEFNGAQVNLGDTASAKSFQYIEHNVIPSSSGEDFNSIDSGAGGCTSNQHNVGIRDANPDIFLCDNTNNYQNSGIKRSQGNKTWFYNYYDGKTGDWWIGNFSNSVSNNPTKNVNLNRAYFSVSFGTGVKQQFDEIYTWLNTAGYDTANNYIELVRETQAENTDKYNVSYYGSPVEVSNFNFTVSCDGSSWTNSSTNSSVITCPGASTTVIFGFYAKNTSTNITAIMANPLASTDTTPPAITYYNLTSPVEDCTNWNTDKTNACQTTDTTPTVSINTSDNAYCAIGVSDLNYTDLGSSRNCTVGEGTMKHTCDLKPQDELTNESSNIYISCKDLSNNQNRTSTSGALRVSITNLEASARNAIEDGIKNALISDYVIYTEQRVFVRNSANNQSSGKFDKVVKKLNKIWAFNRVGPSDSLVNMFNITPTLYTLEFVNKTNNQITNLTALLINSTK